MEVETARSAWPSGRVVGAAGVVLLCALGLQVCAARSPEWTERVYAARVFPLVRAGLLGLARGAPFSVAEAALGLGALCVGAVLVRARRRRRALRAVALGACCLPYLYLAFLLAWGLNYAREPLASRLGLVVRPAGADELAELARELLAAANTERGLVLEDGDGVARLRAGRAGLRPAAAEAFAELGAERPALRGPLPLVRFAVLAPLMTRVGITGIYSPFTAEAHVNGRIPELELPFVVCHEVAHGRGIAREDDANFVAYLACRASSDADFRYSGALVSLRYASAALRRADAERQRELWSTASEEVRRDLAALRRFWAAHESMLSDLGARTNDLYLKAQGQVEGTRSYGRMVDLLLAERRTGG